MAIYALGDSEPNVSSSAFRPSPGDRHRECDTRSTLKRVATSGAER